MTKRPKTVKKTKEQTNQQVYVHLKYWNNDIWKSREIEGNHQAQHPTWLLNNIYFSYDGKSPTKNCNKKKQHFLQHKEKHKNTKEAYTDKSKNIGNKVDFVAVFANTTR